MVDQHRRLLWLIDAQAVVLRAIVVLSLGVAILALVAACADVPGRRLNVEIGAPVPAGEVSPKPSASSSSRLSPTRLVTYQ